MAHFKQTSLNSFLQKRKRNRSESPEGIINKSVIVTIDLDNDSLEIPENCKFHKPCSSSITNSFEKLNAWEDKTGLFNPKEETEIQLGHRTSSNVNSMELSPTNGNKEEPEQQNEAYYHRNFLQILNSVLDEEYNKILISEDEMKVIELFKSLSANAQKLYVRLFQRKHSWLRMEKIKYEEIGENLEEVINELVNHKFLHTVNELNQVKEGLEILLMPELKTLSKNYNLGKINKKDRIIEALLQHSKEQAANSFFNHSTSAASKVLKSVKEIVKKCYKLNDASRQIFRRFMFLFILPVFPESEPEGQQQQLLTVLRVNQFQMKYPTYNIVRDQPIFQSREEFLRYEEAKELESEMINCIESKNYEAAYLLYLQALACHHIIEADDSLSNKECPGFLKVFSAAHVYIHCLTMGIDVLQKLKQYNKAIELLHVLLEQKEYCLQRRGHWWERISLNLEFHLKKPGKALKMLLKGLEDEHIQPAQYYILHTRAQKLLSSKCSNRKKNMKLPEQKIREATKVIIEGRMMPNNPVGSRNVFVTSHNDGEIIVTVEELAIEHYKKEGFDQGIHGEGSTFVSLFALLFWDILYEVDVPNTYLTPYQIQPLDLTYPCFYYNRKPLIDKRIAYLREASLEDIYKNVEKVWEENYMVVSLVNWEILQECETVKALLNGFGGEAISGICSRLAQNFRHFHSGLPDLVVWNSNNFALKVVEVKGPADHLSAKQIIWLDVLLQLNIDADVCHVKAVRFKKLL